MIVGDHEFDSVIQAPHCVNQWRNFSNHYKNRFNIFDQFSGNQKKRIEAKRMDRRANFVSIYGIH
jgi:hypothetical protein